MSQFNLIKSLHLINAQDFMDALLHSGKFSQALEKKIRIRKLELAVKTLNISRSY